MYVNNVPALEALPFPVAANIDYIVGGRWAPGDDGGGTFCWVPVTGIPPNTDFGIIIRCVADATGYFKRIYSGPVNVRWFGATMGEFDPAPPIGFPNVINDVTPYVHRARDAAGAGTSDYGTIYFPANILPYVGNFFVVKCNIVGDGYDSILMPKTANTPVLKLGFHQIGNHWAFLTVSKLQIDGRISGVISSNGVEFGDPADNTLAGRWVLQEVMLYFCKIGVFKPYGNIGNSYFNCLFDKNDIGYWAQDVGMQAGTEKFVGCQIKYSNLAGIFVKASSQYGQFTYDGGVMEQNPGFAVLMILTGTASMTFPGVDFQNVWWEGNATATSVTIDSIPYTPRNLRFEGVRSVAFYDSNVRDIELIGSSVTLYNCRNDMEHWPNTVDTDSNSSIDAQELRYLTPPSENIYVHSISFDATPVVPVFDISRPWAKYVRSSVWGPLRGFMMSSLDNLVFSSGQLSAPVSEIWPGWSGLPDGFATDTFQAGTMIDYSDSLTIPTLNITCKEMLLNPNDIVHSPGSFMLESNKYYFWSIHAYLCDGSVSGYFGAEPDPDGSGGPVPALGQVIFKNKQWACSYGIKKSPEEDMPPFYLWFEGNSAGGKFRFCHFQVLKFENLFDATSYMNSKAFSVPGRGCNED